MSGSGWVHSRETTTKAISFEEKHPFSSGQKRILKAACAC